MMMEYQDPNRFRQDRLETKKNHIAPQVVRRT